MRAPTQHDRILRALERGPLTPLDTSRWSPPIMRLAARIQELREDGHPIKTERPEGKRHAVYVLQRRGRLF